MTIDPRVIRASMGDDPELIREAAADFLPAAHADVAIITQAVSAREAEGVRIGSHRLKGSAAIFGAHDLRHICAELESAARDTDWNYIDALMPKLATRLVEVEQALDEFLGRISTE
jgi:HPt (histidine-containing phosphotransfer) domain-containing protein